MLNPEQLQVESFYATAATQSVSTGMSDGPDCIVYISDCVSCFPDPIGAAE